MHSDSGQKPNSYCTSKLIENSYHLQKLLIFIKAIGCTFYGFTGVISPLAMLGTQKITLHLPESCDLEVFLVFSKHPVWAY